MNKLYDNAPQGLLAQALPPKLKPDYPYLWITEDLQNAQNLHEHLQFFHPKMKSLVFPDWDCLPYDRLSPDSEILAMRMACLAKAKDTHFIIAPLNAVMQRLPPKSLTQGEALTLQQGQEIDLASLQQYLASQAYERVDTVRTAGEYSVRGSLLDIFASGESHPYRIDFFADEIEKIRLFDPLSQLSSGEQAGSLTLHPSKEIILSQENALRFCQNYRTHFGTKAEQDAIFQAVKNRIAFPSMEHWLPCFYDDLGSLFDYVSAVIGFEDLLAHAKLRLEMIADHHSARVEALKHDTDSSPYRPLATDALYLSQGEWQAQLDDKPMVTHSRFANPKADESLEGKVIENLTHLKERRAEGDLFTQLKKRISAYRGKKILIACQSAMSLERTQKLLHENKVGDFPALTKLDDMKKLKGHRKFMCVLPLVQGFESKELIVFSEADIFGATDTRMRGRRAKRGEDFIREVSALNIGELAVHEEHGIGRFLGLQTITVENIAHECAVLEYADSAKLSVPVENIEVLSRYGGEDMNHALDNLGLAGWETRKARIKKKLKDMTEKLVAAAAERALVEMPIMVAEGGDYDEFASGFPYVETDDQLGAIEDVMRDLASGKPMDRLICGDVGFGKTEIALRASFINAYQGGQTAIIAPTTLLARQHYLNFTERFKPFAVSVKMLSRFTTQGAKKKVREGLADGSVDIVIGTHAVLQKSVSFKNLTLAIIDEEQHFGVKQKQKLRDMGANAHILTLTATPIPRTMQMAVHGIQDMSIIATPPIDRLAVHTFTLPYDTVTVRDAIMRERMRTGQFFAVVPRISDLRHTEDVLKRTLPDLNLAMAHGQMPPEQMENIISRFIDGEIEGLLSTHIIESGIDIPNANTMFIFRPEMFSLAQLYQLRGRIGRSNRRGYCYMMSAEDKILTKHAQKRLEIMQTLDNVGAGFTLASYDLDLRGAGNLLGEEQSGHIREVGVELFQKLLRQAVKDARARLEQKQEAELQELRGDFSPVLNLGVNVMIPEDYIPDLQLRLSFYQKLARLVEVADIAELANEMRDRFGALPPELDLLFAVTEIKINCKKANIAKINAGARGGSFYFFENNFPNVEGLAEFISANATTVTMQADHSLSLARRWQKTDDRLSGLKKITKKLAEMVQK